MNMQRSSVFLVVAALALAPATAFAQSTAPAITSTSLHGGGDWKTDGVQAKETRRWGLDVLRGPDNSLRGRISVADSPLLDGGNVEGRIKGSTVSGAITDDAGYHVATFTGAVTRTGMSGSYTDRTGETGTWSWDGPPPK